MEQICHLAEDICWQHCAPLWLGTGVLALYQKAYGLAHQCLMQSLELWYYLDDHHGIAITLEKRGILATAQTNWETGHRSLQASLDYRIQ
ncbi:MAG: hypothetical protein GFH25_541218n36 [Chloroflexi bacterium AL-N10]|nr:hypothetical protein [Chloroflexi bacterium AL-N1]NOK69898.1 hypothetical protein [Chloroflexi bacterium AL-N10]NOK91631.1 hypothetical protein [Chloroflexi bacterium AL-N15]